MGFLDKIKKIVNVNEGEYYDDSDVIEEDEEETYYDDDEVEEDDIPITPKPSFGFRSADKTPKVVDINRSPGKTKPKVILAKPTSFDESPPIADHINKKHMIILNLEAANKDVSLRLFDFLGGVAYANFGAVKRVAAQTFVITPQGYEFLGDELDEYGLGSFFG